MSFKFAIPLPPSGPAGNREVGINFLELFAKLNTELAATVQSGTANRLAYYSASTTISDLAAITASRALISDANGLPTHSAVTSTELGHVSGVTSAIQTQLNGKLSTGGGTLSGALTITPTTNQLVLGTTNTTTISSTAPASSRTVTIPDPGGNANFVMSEGTQTINGTKTFSGSNTHSGACTFSARCNFTSGFGFKADAALSDNLDVSGLVLVSEGSGSTINGLSNGVAGQIVMFWNLSSTNTTTFVHNSGTGTQKFLLPGSANMTVGPRRGTIFFFDGGTWNNLTKD